MSWLAMVVSTLALFACAAAEEKSSTEMAGLTAMGRWRPLEIKPPTQMREFKVAVHRAATRKVGSGILPRASAREHFRAAMVGGLVRVKGMPRDQLSAGISGLLSDEIPCAGASCTRIFGLTSAEVPQFLDETAQRVKNDVRFDNAELAPTQEILLRSLQRSNVSTIVGTSGNEPIYKDLASVKLEINRIISDQMGKLARMIREQRYQINLARSDEELFMSKNCGPASIALQKILADHGIYAEARVNDLQSMDHEYLLYRPLLSDGKHGEIVIDATYRQFLFQYTNRQLFRTFSGGTLDDAAVFAKIRSYDFPKVLIVEYSNLDETLAHLGKNLPDFDYKREIRFAYEKGPFDSRLRREHREYLSEEQMSRIPQVRR